MIQKKIEEILLGRLYWKDKCERIKYTQNILHLENNIEKTVKYENSAEKNIYL